jgi:hypothetical protein
LISCSIGTSTSSTAHPTPSPFTGGYVGKHISPFLGHLKLGQLDPDAVTATGAGLHKHYRPGRWVSASFGGSACAVAQPPVLVAAIYDVLPLEARLDRVALIDSAAGELWPVSASP